MYKPVLIATALLVLGSGVLYARSPAAFFDALMPEDPGVRQIVSSAAYGTHLRQTLDVYAPGEQRGRLPILFFAYGGSWAGGSKDDYGFAGAAFAAQGFVTVVADYRVHPDVVYPDFLDDCAAALAWVTANAERIGGDPDRIVLAGHSAGAYNVAMLALDPQWLSRAGVPQGAVKGWAGLAGPYDFLPLEDPATIRTFSHVKELAATQPVNFVSKSSPPAFLATGTGDTIVSPRHTKELATQLEAIGINVEVKYYRDVGHVGLATALAWPLRWRAPVLQDMASFLKTAAAD